MRERQLEEIAKNIRSPTSAPFNKEESEKELFAIQIGPAELT